MSSLTNALSMVHGLLALCYCIFSTQTLVVVGAIYYLHYRASPTSKLLRRICLERVKRSISRTRVVLIYLTNQCLNNVVPMLLLDEDYGVVYLYHCDL